MGVGQSQKRIACNYCICSYTLAKAYERGQNDNYIDLVNDTFRVSVGIQYESLQVPDLLNMILYI